MLRGVIACCAIALVAAGCGVGGDGSSSGARSKSPSAATSAVATGRQPTSVAQLCAAQTWPRPVPAVVGMVFGDVSVGALGCWNNLVPVGPDGHDIPNVDGNAFLITAVSPAPGTLIGPDDTITVHVTPESVWPVTPPLHPCDWITDAEVGSILGQSPSVSLPTDDETGSVAPSCQYTLGSSSTLLLSQLKMPGSFLVDASTDFNFFMAVDEPGEKSIDIDGLPGHARCTSVHRDSGELRTLKVLLSNNRTYTIYASDMSCETLKRFAQIAIKNIGHP